MEVSTTTGEPVTSGSFNDSDRSVSRGMSVEDLRTIQIYRPAIPQARQSPTPYGEVLDG